MAEVTDGKVPTKIQLYAAKEPGLLMAPGEHSAASSDYRLTLGTATANLSFPSEKAPRRKIASAGAVQIAGGVLATDLTLGAYRDTFRLSFRQMSDGKTTFGLSALNGDTVRDTVGAELSLSGPIVYAPLDTGETSIGIDLDNDGKPDLQIFDRLTTPRDYDGGGPPAQSRNHEIRITGPAVGTERTYTYQYRFGSLNGVNSMTGAVNVEAARNAEAVASLAEQGKTTTLDESLDQIEIAMLSMRRRAAVRDLLTQDAFDKNVALWQVLVRLRSQVPTGVPPALKAEAVQAAQQFSAEVAKDLEKAGDPPLRVVGFVAESLNAGAWGAAMSLYSAATGALDTAIRARMEKAGGTGDKDLAEAKQLGTLRGELMEIPRSGKVIRVAATYHPDERFRTEQGYVSMVPLHLYAWKEDDEWKLKDVTNPDKPFTYSRDAEPGELVPPLALFSELDDPDHFPAGAINIQIPGGEAGRVSVRDRMTWKKFFTYLGLSLAVIGFDAGDHRLRGRNLGSRTRGLGLGCFRAGRGDGGGHRPGRAHPARQPRRTDGSPRHRPDRCRGGDGRRAGGGAHRGRRRQRAGRRPVEWRVGAGGDAVAAGLRAVGDGCRCGRCGHRGRDDLGHAATAR